MDSRSAIASKSETFPKAKVLINQQASNPPLKPRGHPVPVGQKGSRRLSPTKQVNSRWPWRSVTRQEFSAWKKRDKNFVKMTNNLLTVHGNW